MSPLWMNEFKVLLFYIKKDPLLSINLFTYSRYIHVKIPVVYQLDIVLLKIRKVN
jgi:hypothetical protein